MAWPPDPKKVEQHDKKADPKRAAKKLPYSGGKANAAKSNQKRGK